MKAASTQQRWHRQLHEGRRLPALDGVRAVAVGAVLVFHTWPAVLPGGWVGVDVFFVISGYLITVLLLAEWARSGRISLDRFYLRRALRLLPALAVAVLMAMWLAAVARPELRAATVQQAIAAALYVENWAAVVTNHGRGLLGHTWSLSIEEQFYLAWPLLLWGLLTAGGRRAALGVTLVGIALVAAHRIEFTAQVAYFRTDTRADSLLVGCAIAAAAAGALDRLPVGMLRVSAAGGAAVLLVIGLTNAPGLSAVAGYTVIAAAAGAVVVPLTVRPLTTPTRLLSWRPLVAIGRRSYGVYLYHYPIYHSLIEPRLGHGPGALLVTATLTLLCAAASFRYLEAPFLRRRTHALLRPALVPTM